MMYYIEATVNGGIEFEFARDLKTAKKIFEAYEEEIWRLEPCVGDNIRIIELEDTWLQDVITSEEWRDDLYIGIVEAKEWTAEE